MLTPASYLLKGIFPFLLALTLSCNTGNNHDIIALVNKYPITKNELQHWMLLQRAEIHNYYFQKYGINDSENFWEDEIDGTSPLEMLKELAFQKAVRCKVQQVMALEKGLVDQIDFDQMMLEMEEENLERQNKTERGEVIYGAKAYTKRSYFAHEFDLMTTRLKSELAKNELKASDDELKALLKNKDYSLENNAGFYQLQYVEQNYESFVDSLTAAAEINLFMDNWKSVNTFFR